MKIAQMFLDECPKMMRELEVAIADRDQSVLVTELTFNIHVLVAMRLPLI